MYLKRIIVSLAVILLVSCTPQNKAETAVSEFITKYATYPESYEPIDFTEIQPFTNRFGLKAYKIKHAYRIKNKSGVLITTGHEFKLSEKMIVYVDFMEEFE